MADTTGATLGSLRPAVVEVIPAATVDALVAGNERELASLRRDLEEAMRDAEIAEARLRDIHGGVLVDDEFEAEVMQHAARSATEIESGIEEEIRRLLTDASQQAGPPADHVTPPPAETIGMAPAAPTPAAEAVPAPHFAPPEVAPSPPRYTATPVSEPPQPKPSPSSFGTAHFVPSQPSPSSVVPPDAPPAYATSVLTQVTPPPPTILGGSPSSGAAPATSGLPISRPAAPTAAPTPMSTPEPAAPRPQGAVNEEFWAEEREAATTTWSASNLPVAMLLEISAVIVIMALILWKLA